MKNLYEVYCMDCGKSEGVFLESLSEFKDEFTCDFCNKELSVSEDVIVLYKVQLEQERRNATEQQKQIE